MMDLNDDSLLTRAAALEDAGIPFALVTVVRTVSPTSARPGAKAIVCADGVIQGWIGGGCAQPAVIKSVKQALDDSQSRLIRISPGKTGPVEDGIIDFGMSCHSGGTLDIFIDPVLPQPILLIVGGSPTAQALAGLAPRVGFAVTVACHGADRETFPDATRLHDGFDLGPCRQNDPSSWWLRPRASATRADSKRPWPAALNTSPLSPANARQTSCEPISPSAVTRRTGLTAFVRRPA